MAPPAPAVAPAAVAFAAAGAVASQEPADEIVAPAAAAAALAPAEPTTSSTPLSPVGLRPIEDVEGIGPASGQKLVAAGVRTTEDLLNAGATRAGRQRLADATGISGQLILEWVNHVDLMRVPGVGPQYSDLLEAAGVDSPAELVQRNAANLATTIQEVVAARPGIVRRMPTEAEVAGWIEAARSTPRVVEH
jgi:predicted flap endonuclease-1-like 5' DNA nuclease